MLIFFQELVLQLFLWLLRLIDGIMEIFSVVSGVGMVSYKGEQVNLVEFVIGNNTVSTIFWCIFILAIGLTCIFGIAALIKNMLTTSKTISAIIGKIFLSLLGTMAMLAVVILGILISDAVLKLIAEIFEIGNTTKLSNALFNACVGDWLNGYTVNEVDVSSLSVREIFGNYNATAFGIWPTSWKCNGMVNPNTFLYLPAMIAAIGLGIALIVAIVNLAKRVYELVFMYIVMPLSMSTMSVDDGARFKAWRETFISKIAIAYGTVFSVNIFVLILPLISSMRIAGTGSFGNSLFLIFMILGGAMVIPAGQTLFARLFGTADDMHAGGGFLRSAFYGGRVAGAMSLHAVTNLFRGTARAGKKIVTHGRKSSDSSGNSGTGGGDEKYTEEKTVTTDGGNKA